MNEKFKKIAVKSFEKCKSNTQLDPNKHEAWIDAYVYEVIKNTVFECSDLMRESAKHASPASAKDLKVAVIDMLDQFGL